jgi:hypothetical protein
VLSFQELDDLSRGAAVADVACPLCGPSRRAAVNRARKVLRIWNSGDDFISYFCSRCEAKGYAHPDGAKRSATLPKRKPIQAAKPEPDKSQTARFLWSVRKPIAGTIAETYLRNCRGYHGPLPATLGFLPANDKYEPAMIAAFGIAAELEPGQLAVNDDAVTGVHMTKLRPDGSGKADVEKPKIMLGSSKGQPIVVAPCNDLLGLAITEGIEDALTVHELTGLGAWAAGSAGRLPALADVVPDFVDCVSVFVDADDVGRKNAVELVARLKERGIYAEPLELGAAHA